MIVIAKDAEKKLLKELNRHKQDLSQIICVHVGFSQVDTDKAKLFNHFLDIIERVPESYLAEVYICADHDVFILMHAFMESAFSVALKELADTLNIEIGPSVTHRYAVDEHHEILESICREKQEELEPEEEQQKQNGDKLKNVADILGLLEINLVETLARRRQTRREPMVLVIEDDQLSRTLVANTLRPKYETLSSVNGIEGLNLYLEHAPDVVFLDIGLPDINGHDVLECLFKLDPQAYIIMFSGRKDKANIMRALKAGAQGFIGKPFTREKLFEYIGKSPFIQNKEQKGARVQQVGA